jgi:hypothetical protein
VPFPLSVRMIDMCSTLLYITNMVIFHTPCSHFCSCWQTLSWNFLCHVPIFILIAILVVQWSYRKLENTSFHHFSTRISVLKSQVPEKCLISLFRALLRTLNSSNTYQSSHVKKNASYSRVALRLKCWGLPEEPQKAESLAFLSHAPLCVVAS